MLVTMKFKLDNIML